MKTPLADPGPKPQFKWLPIDELFVDVRYQRGTGSERSRKNLKHMKQSFTWSACGALIVSLDPVKKKYAIIDGQHRMTAAKQRGDIKEMPCLIVDRAQMKEQAESFVSINTRRVNLGKLQTFPAAICSATRVMAGSRQPDGRSLRATRMA